MQPGLYKDLSNDDYHAHEGSVSRSGLLEFMRSPYNYWAHYINPGRPGKEMTAALKFGRALHEYVLEPVEFAKHFAVKPTKVLLKNVGREVYDEYKAICEELENSNLIVLDDEDFYNLRNMYDALLANDEARELIQGAAYEQSYFWNDPESGLLLKARPDILHRNIIVDLKSCADASPQAFQRDIYTYGYYIQAPMMQDAIKAIENRYIETFINVCVEKTYPWNVGIYIIDQEAIDLGRVKYKQASVELSRCIAYNEWPGYEIATIGLPRWAC